MKSEVPPPSLESLVFDSSLSESRQKLDRENKLIVDCFLNNDAFPEILKNALRNNPYVKTLLASEGNVDAK